MTTALVPSWTLADRLRKAREQTGLDQGRFADEIEVSRLTVSKSERGVSVPQRVVLTAWALRSGVSRQWLETGCDPAVEPGMWAPWDSNPQPTDYGRAA